MSWYLTVNYLYPCLQLCHPTLLWGPCFCLSMLCKECPRKKNQPTLSNVKSQSTIKSACFCCLITKLQCNVQLWFSHGVQKACNCEQVPMTTWKNSPASKGLVLLINTPAYSYRFVLSAWYKSLCTKKPLALTAVYLITEETISKFQALEDQNLICSLVAWFLTIGYFVAARRCYY